MKTNNELVCYFKGLDFENRTEIINFLGEEYVSYANRLVQQVNAKLGKAYTTRVIRIIECEKINYADMLLGNGTSIEDDINKVLIEEFLRLLKTAKNEDVFYVFIKLEDAQVIINKLIKVKKI